jgi:LPS-assembly protein
MAMTSWGLHHIEPIAQLVARPNETRIGKLPNEDAQSLVFDENSIFSYNRFSGYDRVEGGTRLNYGGRYTFRSNGTFFASLLVGQSHHLTGRNSYGAYDLANTGRNSGLETRRSDYVTAATVQPFTNFSVTARGRFDEKTYGLRRADITATASLGPVSLAAAYSRISPQPEIGYPFRREGLKLTSTVQLPRNFYVTGSVLYDMDRYLTDRVTAATFNQTYSGSPWQVAATTLGFGYRDECTDLSVVYSRSVDGQLVNTGAGYVQSNARSTTVLVRLVLRELLEGQTTYKPDKKK